MRDHSAAGLLDLHSVGLELDCYFPGFALELQGYFVEVVLDFQELPQASV
ncbi:hypothetical protein L195_g051371 [Trifolium pratense]|uniref:Uncharacterized protein n=1 Tax=Trifolium pratense TaxID=57577 RepID=A0A2K3JZ80_TRIPR|nr:hypothetical protein L195_g051371 [Trifolium pratense]